MPLRGGDGGGVGYMIETVRSASRTKGKAKVSGSSEIAKVAEVLVSLLSNPWGSSSGFWFPVRIMSRPTSGSLVWK